MKPPYDAPAQPMRTYLDFEKPIAELEGKVEELRQMALQDDSADISDDVLRLETKAATLLKDTYTKLSRWQKVQVARHPNRPHFLDFATHLIDDFTPLSGDRKFANDEAVVGGLGGHRRLGQHWCLCGRDESRV